MMTAAAPYAAWLSASATHAEQAAAQIGTVAAEFEAVRLAVVHPIAVAANRIELVRLAISNLFGQNFPAIAAAESQYEQMWAQDVSAMSTYHSAASAAASALSPFTRQLQNLAGLGQAAGATAAEAADTETEVQQDVAGVEATVAQDAAAAGAVIQQDVAAADATVAQVGMEIQQDVADTVATVQRSIRNKNIPALLG
jgi:PPE-repeat protein